MEPIIEISGLSKRYKLYNKPLDRLVELMTRGHLTRHQELWALRDIDLSVQPGESIGFIGSNGAGKSTLLKLISGISQPTLGAITVRGRISALMELGAGFHYEFTGRENIYMNCSIMGMSRKETDDRIQQIIDFSELGDFIDHPIKIYSSGMFMRLGFSVAINTDPDILLIDEILAVGDEYFQSKCYQKIKEFREKGKTVIFVSHAINTLRGLCGRAVWLDGGHLRADGHSVEVTDLYLDYQRERIGRTLRSHQSDNIMSIGTPPVDKSTEESPVEIPDMADQEDSAPLRQGTREAEILKVEILSEDRQPCQVFTFGQTLVIRLSFRASRPIPFPNIGVSIWRNDNVLCYGSSSAKDGTSLAELPPRGQMEFIIPQCRLMNGQYEVSVAIFCPDDIHPYDFHNRLYHFSVNSTRRDEGMNYLRHEYRYILDDGQRVIERPADPSAPAVS